MKKKVCFVSENALGGIVNINRGLIGLLGTEDFEFSVVLINYPWREMTAAETVFDGTGASVYTLEISHDVNKFRVLDRLQRQVLSRQDLIIATDRYELIACCIGRLTVPVIFMIHSNFDSFYTVGKYFRGIIDSYVCISEEILSRLKAALGEPAAGAEGQPVAETRPPAAVYLPHAIPGYDLPFTNTAATPLTIAFVGRFGRVKGSDIILEIGRHLKEKGGSPNFIIITNGVGEEAFRGEWAFNDTTTYYSNLPNKEVQQQLAGAQVILMPSRLEGFPVVLIEAMRRGVVPVCSDISTGFPELVEDGVTGYRLPIAEPEQFAGTLMHLAGDRARLAAMSRAALEAVGKKFDPATNAARYGAHFLELMGRRTQKQYPDISSQLGKFDKPYVPGPLIKFIKRFYKSTNQAFL